MRINICLKLKILLPVYIVLACAVATDTYAQLIDTSANRVQTSLMVAFPYLGSIKSRPANEIASSNWLLGCETLDRDYANYDEYKDYLVPLGIKRLRFQSGWDKTEKVKGFYDWAWLDHIINDAIAKGLQPWLQISYGNHNYPDGGGANLGAGVPKSEIALAAWDNYVKALVTRYKGKVKDWEIWNEPNFADNSENTPEKAASLNVRTIKIIKKIQPDARVSGMALGHISIPYADAFLKVLRDKKQLKNFDNITYHDYVYNPDSHYGKVEQLRTVLQKYSSKVKLRQGENGAPSEPNLGGALGDYAWSELSQAKWDTRRMLGDLGHDIESSVFTIIEIPYTAGPITKLNVKGLIKSDATQKAIRPKMAYYAVQNVVSVFDNNLQRIKNLHHTNNVNDIPASGEVRYSLGTDHSISFYGYQHVQSKKQVFTIWADDNIPTNSNIPKKYTVTILNANMESPVYVDVISGKVFEIPKSDWSKSGGKYIFKDIPVYDSPILIADRSLILTR